MQCAVIDFARNICEMKNANSTEFDKNTEYPVIDIMLNQKNISDKGATMRLGSYACDINRDSILYDLYNTPSIEERHRHRYEFNNNFFDEMQTRGLKIAGINKKLNLVEAIEIIDHPWFVGVQFHPELKSRLMRAHPLFDGFIKASSEYSNSN
jgi:CTP synthase